MGEPLLAIHRQSLAMPISVLITDRTGIGPVPVANISSRFTILQFKCVICRMGFGPAVEPQHMTVRVCDYKLADNLVLGKVYVPGEVLVITTPGDAMKKPGDVNPLWKKYGVAVSRVPLGVTVAEDKTGTGIAKELVDAMKQRVDLPPSKIKHYSRDGAAPAVAGAGSSITKPPTLTVEKSPPCPTVRSARHARGDECRTWCSKRAWWFSTPHT